MPPEDNQMKEHLVSEGKHPTGHMLKYGKQAAARHNCMQHSTVQHGMAHRSTKRHTTKHSSSGQRSAERCLEACGGVQVQEALEALPALQGCS